ncbi:PAS domain S-box protein [Tenacibaculum sp. AHE15PA]|uniref:PAS domain-containing sensor histidine kinase n=1 Tax=unclassified Tenacibaculum TaxID=2635139 RepID=UPI001C4FF995|nr:MULTISPECIES: PAS domain S-box protein [unclassified Tenacibaculum]QXP73675.1 PAS domain S-box protein [Tenacibaculum sp. AHE14PA]QXP75958.1 PAS domain S-box protein [Tenacibaculum sp. AHE15PA]
MCPSTKIDILQRALKREKKARKIAEKILEDKSRELYSMSEELKDSNIKLAELLEDKSLQLKGVFENINDSYLIMDLAGNVLKMNNAAIEFFGYDISKEKLSVINLIYPEDNVYAFQSFSQLYQTGSFSNYTARILTKEKEVKWVQINASLIYDKIGKKIAAQGIVRDITKQITSEEKLLEYNNRLSALVLNLNSGIVLEDENRKIVLSNKKFCKLFKIDSQPDDLIGMDCKLASEQNKVLFKHSSDFVRRMDDVVEAKIPVYREQLEMIDGKILERNYTPIIVDSKIKGYLWTFTDITLEKKYNLSLESEKEKYSNIIANMNLGLVEINRDNQITMINQRFIEMSGYNEEELIGKVAHDIFNDNDNSNFIDNEKEKRIKGVSSFYEFKTKNKKGETKYWHVSTAPNYNLLGENVGTIALGLDITKTKKLQLQKEQILKELEKSNNQLHEYAHIVSHDLKSPLRSIDALVSWIKTDNNGKFDETTLENFNLISTTLETMEKLISNVLEYSSAGSITKEKEDVDLNITLNDLKKILFIPKNISVTILKKLPIIKGDKTKFQQLFQNFISNAIKFCDKEIGIIEVDYQENKNFHQFSIKDNGIGIEKKYHDKIFQVFHSLNKREDSTGIGLSIVRKIIDLHEGDVWLESKLNKGTTFYFTIKKN